jgi:hypothetical protein
VFAEQEKNCHARTSKEKTRRELSKMGEVVVVVGVIAIFTPLIADLFSFVIGDSYWSW